MKLLKTSDGKHGARIMRNGDYYDAYAVQPDGFGDYGYWYTIGTSYKTETTAIKYAKQNLAKRGYALVI